MNEGNKKWYASRMIWANLLMLIGSAVQQATGHDILSADLQLQLLATINLILRWRTNTGIE